MRRLPAVLFLLAACSLEPAFASNQGEMVAVPGVLPAVGAQLSAAHGAQVVSQGVQRERDATSSTGFVGAAGERGGGLPSAGADRSRLLELCDQRISPRPEPLDVADGLRSGERANDLVEVGHEHGDAPEVGPILADHVPLSVDEAAALIAPGRVAVGVAPRRCAAVALWGGAAVGAVDAHAERLSAAPALVERLPQRRVARIAYARNWTAASARRSATLRAAQPMQTTTRRRTT